MAAMPSVVSQAKVKLARSLAARLLIIIGCLIGPANADPQPAWPGRQVERPRLFYLGLALYSEPWSENDVVELAGELRQSSNFDVVPLIASNHVSRHRTYPIA